MLPIPTSVARDAAAVLSKVEAAPVEDAAPVPACVDASLSESELESDEPEAEELSDAMPLDFLPFFFFLLAFPWSAVLLSSRGSATGGF
jgi:hypothetical protein